METKGQEKFIGLNENMRSEEFKNRRDRDKPSYNKKPCPRFMDINGLKVPVNFELAELKSSLLIQNILNNSGTNTELKNFIIDIMVSISSKEKFEKELKTYSDQLSDSKQKDHLDNYPVAQMKRFAGNPDAIINDFLAIYSFLKYGWVNIINRSSQILTSTNFSIQSIRTLSVIHIIQQSIMLSVESSKGPRINLNPSDRSQFSDQVGITNINSEFLTKQNRVNPDVDNEPWLHPGRVQCRVPYMGKYGEYIKTYRENNSLFASIQCGISGSINFGLFMYLANLASKDSPSLDTKNDMINLIVSTTAVLLSDGGHNVRETVTGLTIMIISLKIWLTDIDSELNVQYNKNVDLIKEAEKLAAPTDPNSLTGLIYSDAITFSQKNNIPTPLIVYQNIIYSFGLWRSFIDYMYNFTNNINPLGIFTNDLNNFDSKVLENPDKSYDNAKKFMYNVWFKKVDKFDNNAKIACMLLHSLDNGRYRLHPDHSFKEAPNRVMQDCVIEMNNGNNIIQKSNNQLDMIIENCNDNTEVYGSTYQKIRRNSYEIPFAFSNKPKNKFTDKSVIYIDVCNNCGKQNFKEESGELRCLDCDIVGETRPLSDNEMESVSNYILE